jgi:hypothetical protein
VAFIWNGDISARENSLIDSMPYFSNPQLFIYWTNWCKRCFAKLFKNKYINMFNWRLVWLPLVVQDFSVYFEFVNPILQWSKCADVFTKNKCEFPLNVDMFHPFEAEIYDIRSFLAVNQKCKASHSIWSKCTIFIQIPLLVGIMIIWTSQSSCTNVIYLIYQSYWSQNIRGRLGSQFLETRCETPNCAIMGCDVIS